MILDVRKAACVLSLALLCSLRGVADDAAAGVDNWSGSFLARVEAIALLQTLNAQLLSNNSATVTLEHWCAIHRLAATPQIIAQRVAGIDTPASPEQRRELRVSPTEPVHYRRVRLLCGSLVLSEADNWYVPSRLTPEMNRLLDATETPFGRVVQAVQFQRRTLSSTVLWHPLPEGWEMNPAAQDSAADRTMPPKVLEHRAVLSLRDGTPFSEVVESYTSNVLAFRVARQDPGR